MGLFDRMGRLAKANLNNTVSQAKDPETVINQKICEMKKELIKLRQALASAIADQKRYQQQYNQNQLQAQQWDSRAKLAIQKGDKNLNLESLQRKKSHLITANKIKKILDQYTIKVDTLKSKLIILESKISEVKTQKNMQKAESKAVKTNNQLQNMIGDINPSGTTLAFEKRLVGADIDSQFAALYHFSVIMHSIHYPL